MPKVAPSHPCADHPCDHCYLCDVVGICCGSVSSAQREQLEAGDPTQRERLYLAIAQGTGMAPSLPELVRQEAGLLPASMRLGLCAPPAPDPSLHDSRKEADLHVIPARLK